jgi:ammonia channel protein AmtB
MVNATQQTGGSLGAALINTIAATATASYLAAHGSSLTSQAAGAVHGYTTAFTFSAIVLTAAAVLAFALIRSSRHTDAEEADAEAEETVLLPVPA